MINAYGQDPHKYPKTNGYNNKQAGRIIGWISGGVASAVACDLALKQYGDDVFLAFNNTHREDRDTFRFLKELEVHWGREIVEINSHRFHDPEEVWNKYSGLNFAHGAPCSTVLKREVREKNQDLDNDFGQVFGFDVSEMRRVNGMIENHPEINPIFPLIVEKMDRFKIFAELKRWGIKPPRTYEKFQNNNCMGDPESMFGGCVQGGIGYWQLIQEEYPMKFERMAYWERKLSARKGKPVTICKDQREGKKGNRLFLTHNPMFPDIENISAIKGRRPVVVQECNGFCGTQIDMFDDINLGGEYTSLET